MIVRFSAVMLAAAFSLPILASAQTVRPVTPCIGCAVTLHSAADQVLVNQLLVRDTLQNGLNSSLQTQSQSLQNQRLLRAAQINAALAGGTAELQRILILEQLDLLQLQGHAVAAPQHPAAAPKKTGKTQTTPAPAQP